MSELPDELWRRILEMGVITDTYPLNFKDLCCIAISCKRLHRLSNETSLWYEKDKAKRIAAHSRAVLRIESRIAEHSRKLEELQMRREEETAKLKAADAELSNLQKVR
ncbi:F-box protein SKIP24 [Bienertia sinuspersici]